MKWIGCCLIVLSGVGLGGHFAQNTALRVRILEELQRDLQYLYGEIAYSASSMPELLEQIAAKGGMLEKFWQGIVAKMKLRHGLTFSELWRQQFSEMREELVISEEGKRLFLELGDNLGNLDRSTQLQTLQLFQERLTPMLHRGWDEYRGQAKVCYVTGLSAGLFLCILLF